MISEEFHNRIQRVFELTLPYACDVHLLDKAKVTLTVTNKSGFDPDVIIGLSSLSHITIEKELRIFLFLRQSPIEADYDYIDENDNYTSEHISVNRLDEIKPYLEKALRMFSSE